jgi:prepilin peptidase CpaA
MNTSLWVCLVVVVVAVVSDVATRRMPNLVTLGGLAVGIAIHAATGLVSGGLFGALRGAGVALLGAVACGLVPFFAWKKGEMGGGDVKLFAAIGALVGPMMGFDVEARAFALSLVVLFPYRLIRHGALGVALRNVGIGLANLFRARAARVPYLGGPKLPPVILGPAIGVAFAITLLQYGVLR